MPAIPKWKAPWAKSARRCIWCRTPKTSTSWRSRTSTPVAYITQTTLSIDDTARHYRRPEEPLRDIVGPETSDICYATQNRQTSVRELAKLVDVILVVGAANSSNSNRLREIGIEDGHSFLPDQ
jgi:4-hydroxy-3-methylbut-2-enyl diphosphate reductase IspH